MADPTPTPAPPPLTGWQWITWMTIQLIAPVLVSGLVSYFAGRYAVSRSDEAIRRADAAHQEATRRPVFYGPAPKE